MDLPLQLRDLVIVFVPALHGTSSVAVAVCICEMWVIPLYETEPTVMLEGSRSVTQKINLALAWRSLGIAWHSLSL